MITRQRDQLGSHRELAETRLVREHLHATLHKVYTREPYDEQMLSVSGQALDPEGLTHCPPPNNN